MCELSVGDEGEGRSEQMVTSRSWRKTLVWFRGEKRKVVSSVRLQTFLARVSVTVSFFLPFLT